MGPQKIDTYGISNPCFKCLEVWRCFLSAYCFFDPAVDTVLIIVRLGQQKIVALMINKQSTLLRNTPSICWKKGSISKSVWQSHKAKSKEKQNDDWSFLDGYVKYWLSWESQCLRMFKILPFYSHIHANGFPNTGSFKFGLFVLPQKWLPSAGLPSRIVFWPWTACRVGS